MFVTRLISGIVLVIAALAVIITGGPVLFLTLLAVSLIGMHELYRVMKVEDEKNSPLAIAGYVGAAGYYALLFFDLTAYTMIWGIGVLIALMFVYVFTYPRYRSEQVMAAFFAT